MKTYLQAFQILLTFIPILTFSQQISQDKKILLTGKIIEKSSNQPLEYATLALVNVKSNKVTSGGITDSKGEFSIETVPGIYDIKIEFISFKPLEIKAKSIFENTSLGIITLQDESQKLDEVVVRTEKTTIDIKLDKKVYNVGKDLMVKGGTVSDVLENIPSVAVDAEGNISLRGNENVRVLIDGKPSNAINVAEALKLIPADAIDKVEVITNPSARYDAEGGGGLLNIILKKGKTNGLNGTLIGTVGYPENNGISANINYKSDDFNFFTTQGYYYRSNPGNSLVETHYINPRIGSPTFIKETRDNDRINKSYNGNFGFDWNIDKTLTWTSAVNYRRSIGDNQDNVTFQNRFDANTTSTRLRTNYENSKSENIEYSSNFSKRFKKEGHKLNIDLQFSDNNDDNIANILDTENGNDATSNLQDQNRNLIQFDYVLPFGKASQFETGYRGDFSKQTTDVTVITKGVLNPNFTNILQYKEKVNAFYAQYGTKIKKFSFLFGLRWEDSNIDVNQLKTNDFNNKKYNNFFPSAFFTYELAAKTNISLSYSKRIQRPRGRQLNPFSNYSSNINIFQGNPDINPAMTDAIDLGFLKSWTKLTLSTSIYVNKTSNVFQFVRRESGEFAITTPLGDIPDIIVNGQVIQLNGLPDSIIPVILSSPINLATEYRTGFEFTLNYTPYKWWRLNSNFNFFRVKNQGDFVYTNFQNQVITQNFDNISNTWSTRLSSKISLPHKIDWQTNFNYDGNQKNAQGKRIGTMGINLAFSKDVLKDKGTIALNVNDLLNSKKRIMETYIPNSINSYTEMQWRERQITLSFTYRFNKKKTEREKPKMDNGGDGGDF